MSWKRTAIFALLLIAMVAVYLWDHHRVERRKSQEQEQKRIFPWKVQDVSELILERPQGRVRLAKGDQDDWRIVEPITAKADKEEVRKLIEALLQATKDRSIADDPSELEAYGLSTPPYILTLKAKDPPGERTLVLGAKNPTEVYHYAKIQGEKGVFLVSDVVRRDAEKPLLDLRDKTVLKFEPQSVERLTIEAQGKKVTLQKEGEKIWKILAEEVLKADADAVESLLFRLSRLKASDFDDDPKDLSGKGLDPPGKSLSLKLKEEDKERRILLGLPVEKGGSEGRKPRLWARIEGENPLIQIDSGQLGEIPVEVDGWRYKVLMSFERDKVDKIELKGHSRSVRLRKMAEGAWEMEEPERLPADSVKVSDLLWTLKDSRVDRFPTKEEILRVSWDDITLGASIWLEGKGEPITLEIGPEAPEGGQYARAHEQEEPVVVSKKLVEELEKFTPWELREKRFVSLDVSKVKRFVARWEGKELEVARRGESDWEVTKPKKEPIEPFKATSILWTVREARFQEPPVGKPEGEYLENVSPKFELLAFGEGKNPLVRFVVSGEIPEKPGSYRAWCEPGDQIYIVAGKLLDEIKRDLKALIPSFVDSR